MNIPQITELSDLLTTGAFSLTLFIGLLKQGGGGTWHSGVDTYIDLIVHDFEELEKQYPQTAGLFAELAKHKQGTSNFGYAELAKDKRLFNLLSKTTEGSRFYSELESKVPIITVSNRILGDSSNIKSVRIFPLSEIEENPLKALESIQSEANLITQDDQVGFLDGIEKLNKIISLQPGFFGCSLNLNQIISDWLEKMKKKYKEK